MRQRPAHSIAAVFELFKELRNSRVINRSTIAVRNQIALADISDVARFFILREKMIEWLIARGADFFRNRLVPLFAVRKDWVDVEDDASEVKMLVTDNFTDAKPAAGLARRVNGPSRLTGKEVSAFHAANMDLRNCETSVRPCRTPRYARIF